MLKGFRPYIQRMTVCKKKEQGILTRSRPIVVQSTAGRCRQCWSAIPSQSRKCATRYLLVTAIKGRTSRYIRLRATDQVAPFHPHRLCVSGLRDDEGFSDAQVRSCHVLNAPSLIGLRNLKQYLLEVLLWSENASYILRSPLAFRPTTTRLSSRRPCPYSSLYCPV